MRITQILPQFVEDIPLNDLPRLLESDQNLLWVDLVGPTDDDVLIMRDVFHFHPLAIEDTRNQRQRPKVEEYREYLFVILNPVTCEPRQNPVFRELDVFVGRNFIVSVHKTPDEPIIEEARRRIERNEMNPLMSSGFLLYTLMDTTVDGYFPVLDVLEEEIEELGDQVLVRPTRESLNRLFELKSTLINLWRVIWPQREILNNLAHHDLPYLNEEAIQHYLRDVTDHLMWMADMITTFRDTLTSVIDLYMSAVSNRLNIVVNRLTVFTVMIGLMGVIAGFYGMNFAQTWPPFDSAWGVPFVLLLMGGIAGVLLYVLRRMNWYE